MGKRYSQEVREEVLAKVRGGKKVSAVAREHGINEMTIQIREASMLLRLSAHGCKGWAFRSQ